MPLGHEGGARWSSPPGADLPGRPLPILGTMPAVHVLTPWTRQSRRFAGLHVTPGSQGPADTDANVLGDAHCGYIYPGEWGRSHTHRHSQAPQPRKGSRTCLLSPVTLVATGPKREVRTKLHG
jgi:hypothetical protein